MEEKMNCKINATGLLVAFCLILALSAKLPAQVPLFISHQGLLIDSTGAPVPDNVYSLLLKIYDHESNGNILWSSDGYAPVQTNAGYFSHLLGTTRPLPDSLVDYDSLWIGITIGFDPELAPRTPITSAGFAFKTMEAEYTVRADSVAFADSAFFTHESYHSLIADSANYATLGDSSRYALFL
jgi:hypothetical protein